MSALSSRSRQVLAGCASGLVIALVGCSGIVVQDEPGGGSATSSGAGGGVPVPDGGYPDEWTPLIDGTWQLAAGTEGYWCSEKTFHEDVYIKAFRALAPPGTHHTLLLFAGGQPDGEHACGATLGAHMLHASGVGTDDLTFPEGVAVKIPAGTQLSLNLHLFNAGSEVLKGVSGTLVKRVTAAEVKQEAEMILAGAFSISIPPNGEQTVEGTCAFPGNATIATVWPHMHQLGTHMTVLHESGTGTSVLHDGPFSFGDQKNYPITAVNVAAGEKIRVQCSYKNPTPETVSFGESSKSEMCFAGLYRYPALGSACQ